MKKLIPVLLLCMLVMACTGSMDQPPVAPEPEETTRVPEWRRLSEPPEDLPSPETFSHLQIAVMIAPARWSQKEFEDIYNNFAQLTDATLIVTTRLDREMTLTNSKTGEVLVPVDYRELDPSSLEALIIAGGGGVDLLYYDEAYHEFLREMAAQGKFLGGICGGPNIIAAAGLVQGRKVAGHEFYASLLEEFGSGYSPEPLVVDNLIITGQAGRERDLVWAMMRAIADRLE